MFLDFKIKTAQVQATKLRQGGFLIPNPNNQLIEALCESTVLFLCTNST
nr:MAG TPA: hypothetical protein [Caudoviricetes sp.]DAT22959.1 MAG TPA: hypothetical protein [Caudoviricetes sp.]